MMQATPLIVSGIFRTGTTIVTDVLDTHPDISITCEQNLFQIWYDLIHKIHIQEERRLAGKPPEKFGLAEIHYEQVRQIIQKSFYNGLIEFHQQRKPEIRYWGDKWITGVMHYTWLLCRFPKMKMILTKRNLRDTLASIKAAWFTQHKPLEHWIKHCKKKQAMIEELGRKNNVFILDFHSLLDRKQWEDLSRFLDVPAEGFNLRLIKEIKPRGLTAKEEELIRKELNLGE